MDRKSVNPTKRFSDRVETYIMYRPSYPKQLIEYLNKQLHLKNLVVADIGAGTGILTKLLLDNGNSVCAIEPNINMRNACISLLSSYENVTFIDGTAEKTYLKDDSVDAIFVAQAFHWFRANEAVKEFYRIIKKNGYIVLLWNELKENSAGFSDDYYALFNKYSLEYSTNNQTVEDMELDKIFVPNKIHKVTFDNFQVLNYEQFIGRLLSSSFSPNKNDKSYDCFLRDATEIFKKHVKEAVVKVDYDTLMFYCKVEKRS